MPQNRSLREEESQLETNLKMSSMPAEVRRERSYLLSAPQDFAKEHTAPDEEPLSFESLSRNYPADKVARYFS